MDRMTVTVVEAAELLGIGRGLAYELARRGELPALRLGRRFVIPKQALERLLSSTTRDGAGDDSLLRNDRRDSTGRERTC